ncbi:MAG TPA: GNAT family N-acetyltransferase, partial [Ramlibacter sp.]
DISFWTAWDGAQLLGCAALRQLEPGHGELKSMRTAASQRRRGVARALLAHVLAEAGRRDLHRLSLETGAEPEFEPARALYRSFGFTECGPFGSYKLDPHSVFMTRELRADAAAPGLGSPPHPTS